MLEGHLDSLSPVENNHFDHLDSAFGFRFPTLASSYGKHHCSCSNIRRHLVDLRDVGVSNFKFDLIELRDVSLKRRQACRKSS